MDAVDVDRDLGSLAAAAATGDQRAFRALIDATHGRLFRLASRLLGHGRHGDAEDIVQETFVRAWQHLPNLKEHNAVLGWLARITRHLVLDQHRRRRRRPTEVVHDGLLAQARSGDGAGPPGGDVAFEQREHAAMIHKAIDDVPEAFRVVLLLKHVDGLSARDIAALLDVPVGTVESRAARGKTALQGALQRLQARTT